MQKYVRVAPELSVEKQFDYSIPAVLEGKIQLGHRLKVPWGQKTVLAYAVAFPEKPQVEKCKDVLEIVGQEPLIPSKLCELAQWVADYYACDFSLALRGMLPEAVRANSDGHKTRWWISVPEHLTEDHVMKILGKARVQQKAWKFVKEHGGGWLTELCLLSKTTHAVWRALADRGFVIFQKEKMERNPLALPILPSAAHDLTDEQNIALKTILEEFEKKSAMPMLLQGVTGSGKTEIYLRALEKVLEKGSNALILVPEISLTAQTIENFRARFEGQKIRVAVMHSHLSSGERHDQWHQIREGTARVVIGARSAVFAPVQKLGLIIVDEEHEHSYKQEETPHYHARDVAVVRAKFENAPIVLGSATPSLESVHNARQGKYKLLKLSKRIDGKELPVIHIVDMRKEKPDADKTKKFSPILSASLRDAVEKRLERGEQAIFFLNRRGFATMVQCPHCGYTEECSHCSVSLTYHHASKLLKCHLCNFQKSVPRKCPECGFDAYKYSGMGTQKIEDVVQSFFPDARWQRMDSDSMRGKFAYDNALSAFREGKTDILIGTQMIAKGLHFPNVTCVGVINTDMGLHLPDFRASERVFQQLVQVAGRAGRGDVSGEVFVQTYAPFHPAIQFARHHDVEGFQDQELEYRRQYEYPPFTRTALVTFRGRSETKTQYCIEQLAKKIQPILPEGVQMADPAPAPIPRVQDNFRFHLFFKTKKIPPLSRLLKKHVFDTEWPDGVKSSVNMDPVNLL